MITKNEIRELLNNIENERVERTVSTNDTAKFAKAICAFANDLPNKKLPGFLMIGTYDDGKLSGLKVTDELLRNLAGLRADGNIQPKPALSVEKISFPEGDIALVEVQPSKITPVKYKGVTYVRIGARQSEANEEDERILREKSEVKSPTFDSTPCLYSTMDDLDLRLFKSEYLPKVIKKKVLKNEKRSIKLQLNALNLYDLEHDRPTVAGILLIGKDPTRILFGAYIQYVKFAGIDRTSRILNERQFSGNIITLLKEIDAFIKYTIQTQRPVFVSVLREELRINYPYEAIRELVTNNIMHRNYQTNSPAKFYEYADRIELDNPGNLYGKVNRDNFPDETDYRNPILAQAIKELGYVNRFGRGIRMVQELLEDNQNGYAIFNFKDITTFKVTVLNADYVTIGANDGADGVNNGANHGANGGVNSGANGGANNGANDINGSNGGINDANNGANAANGANKKIGNADGRADIGANGGANGSANNGANDGANDTNGANKKVDNADGGANVANDDANDVANNGANGGANYGANGVIGANENAIFNLIKKNNRISRGSIAMLLGIGTTTVYRYIEILKNRGAIERIGGKKGYWKIIQ